MMLNEEERNEFYRAKHAKSIKAALYELGILISTLYLADQAAEIWPQYKEPAFMVAVAMLFCDDRLGTTQLEINDHLRKGPQ
jgi:hypothetical protein